MVSNDFYMISIKFCVVSTAGNAMKSVQTGVDKNGSGDGQETLESLQFAICISSTLQSAFLHCVISISASSSHTFSQHFLNDNLGVSISAHFLF